MIEETEDEGEEYSPEPTFIQEDSCVIGDLDYFLEVFNGIAAQYRDGAIYVLDADSHKWVNVEDHGKPEATKPKLTRVQ